MANISKLEGLKRQATKEGWNHFIRTPVDEKALLQGYTFSFPHFDHVRFFFENFLVLSKGRWKDAPFEILPYQEMILGSLFGWINEAENIRRFSRGLIEVGKKNGKTSLGAGIGLYMLIGDGEPSPEIYNVANDREQAGILWKLAADMVESSPKLLESIKVLRSTKVLLANGKDVFSAWSSDQSSKDGPNAHCILVDELHAWRGEPSREMWRKIRYAGIARKQPICPLVLTTAGDDKFSLCYEIHDYAKRILHESSINDLSFFAFISAADEKKIKTDPDYWQSEEAWKAANPAYEVILKKETFLQDIEEVKNHPPAKAAFLRYRLNLWMQTETSWLANHIWLKNKGLGFTEKDLKDGVCFAGLDLSSTNDFTAVSYVFPFNFSEKETHYKILVRLFCPEDTVKERVQKLGVDVMQWIEDGYIICTPGDCIDHEFILQQIKKDAQKFSIKELGYDRYSAAWLILKLQETFPHLILTPVNQSMKGMSNATKGFTMALQQGRVQHNGNPVLEWMAGNATPVTDDQENMMLSKKKSKDKIDGIIASIIAYGQAEIGKAEIKKRLNVYGSDDCLQIVKELDNIS